MLSTQIAYWQLQETKRHQLATEKEDRRSHKAAEKETNRHNVAYEIETNRHNLAQEDLQNRTLEENIRENKFRDRLDTNKFTHQKIMDERNYWLNKQDVDTRAQSVKNSWLLGSREADIKQQEANTRQYVAEQNAALGWTNAMSQVRAVSAQEKQAETGRRTQEFNALSTMMSLEQQQQRINLDWYNAATAASRAESDRMNAVTRERELYEKKRQYDISLPLEKQRTAATTQDAQTRKAVGASQILLNYAKTFESWSNVLAKIGHGATTVLKAFGG